MATQTLILLIATLGAVAAAAWRARPWLVPLAHARPANRLDRPWQRLTVVLADIGLHRRLLRIRFSGVMHLMIFTSFLVLFTVIVQAFGAGFFPGFSLEPIGGHTWLAAVQEVFTVVIAAALGMAIWHRFVRRPARFAGSNRRDATTIYALIAAIVVTMLLEWAARIAAGGDPSEPYRPLSAALAGGLGGLGLEGDAAATASSAFYWAHIASILAFLVYIPGSKHRHMFAAAPNIFFRSLAPKGQLPPPPPAGDSDDQPGTVQRFSDFTWKDLLDGLSCTECGRCQAVCPAHGSGAELSPKQLVMDLRDGMTATNERGAAGDSPIAGGTVSTEALWACTTCRACMEVCPLHIEHVPKIVQLRRSLVEEGEIEPMLQDSLTSLQSYGNSFGKSPKQRARWTRGLSFKPKDVRKEAVDVLWFVGDFSSFDPRVQRLTVLVAELLAQAEVDFGILYEGERNSGNDVRRVGDEGLFDLLARHNIAELEGCSFNRILTTDPHSLNALSNEYAALGAHYDVVHHTKFLWELLEAGRLDPVSRSGQIVTYHDPCYLGRYNDEFEAPRRLIRRLGHDLHDMGRCRENSYCCGAGGGRIWMDDSGLAQRPSENRIEEALALEGVTRFVVSCPKDVVMYTAAVQALGVEDRIAVWEIAELLDEALRVPQPGSSAAD
ncbi:MAG: (Fe-S)-binding protein [Rhodospirillales bacterium]|nr:(Fe-S)-binding protein [Rhodospirillales bacterium]